MCIRDSPTPEDRLVLAPIAPGVIPPVAISSWRRMADRERISIEKRYCTVALDGERSFAVTDAQQLELEVRRDGPPVIDVNLTLKVAANRGLFNLSLGN